MEMNGWFSCKLNALSFELHEDSFRTRGKWPVVVGQSVKLVAKSGVDCYVMRLVLVADVI